MAGFPAQRPANQAWNRGRRRTAVLDPVLDQHPLSVTPYTRIKEPTAPKLGRFRALIDEILAADEKAPRKQRHWATQIFRRLAKEGYEGGYDQVRRYVAKRRRREQETFIPLDHDPGQRVEADFGHIWVDFPEGRRRVPVLLLTWAFSYCPFAIAQPIHWCGAGNRRWEYCSKPTNRLRHSISVGTRPQSAD